MATWIGGSILLVNNDSSAALPQLQEAAAQFAEIGNAWGLALAQRHISDIETARGNYDGAERALEQAIQGWHAVGAVAVSSALTLRLANVHALAGRTQEADTLFNQAIADAERQRYAPTLALAYNLYGITLRRRGLLDDAEQYHQAALSLCRDRGSPAGLSLSFASLGYLSECRGDAISAEQHHLAGLDAARDANDVRAQALALEGLAGVASLRGDDEGVGRFLGAAAVLREATGGTLVRAERADVERALEHVGNHVVMDAGYAAGRTDPTSVIASTRTMDRTSQQTPCASQRQGVDL
jgi:tetratricopeptide (TPR) repeat protein